MGEDSAVFILGQAKMRDHIEKCLSHEFMSLINICNVLVSSAIVNPISGADGVPNLLACRPSFLHSTTDKKEEIQVTGTCVYI